MRIYVVVHKKVEVSLPNGYQFVQVGPGEDIYPLRDNTGDNIAERNPTFCELTALYWVWKNDKASDVVGFSHYRRYFTTSSYSNAEKYYLTCEKALKDLEGCDLICTNPYVTKTNVREHFMQKVSEHDLGLLRETIAEVCPQYLGSFDEVMKSRSTYLLNMIIMRKPLFDKYCAWLFSILFAMEPKVDMTGYTTEQRRLYGFLGEFLLMVYIRKNGLKAKSRRVALFGVSEWSIAIDKFKRLPEIIKDKLGL